MFTSAGEFWVDRGMRYITPGGELFPEGFNPGDMIAEILNGRSVTEVGCGVGRLARSFAPDRYVGVDISPTAIEFARAMHPDHQFHVVGELDPYPKSDAVLLYTVALHVADEDIGHVLRRAGEAAGEYVVIAEIMDRNWRRAGSPPVFNRDFGDYVEMMRRCPGFELERAALKPYRHYAENPRVIGKSTNLTTLVFRKMPPA